MGASGFSILVSLEKRRGKKKRRKGTALIAPGWANPVQSYIGGKRRRGRGCRVPMYVISWKERRKKEGGGKERTCSSGTS